VTFKRHNHGASHSYSEDGRKIPGVTTILGAGIPKSGLIKWAGEEVAEYVVDRLTAKGGHIYADDLVRDVRAGAKYPIPDGLPRTKLAKELSFAPSRTRDKAGLKGTQVHKIAQQLLETGEWTPGEGQEHLEGYADALESWFAMWQPGAGALLERPVLNRSVFYAGTFDLVAPLITLPGLSLVDYKAGRSGIFGETALQGAAYRYAEIYVDAAGVEQPMPKVSRFLGVWLRPDGTHETYPIAAGPEEFRIFRYVYELAKWLAGPDLFKLEGEEPAVRTVKGDAIRPDRQDVA
jgi:hypothetical protein